MSVDEFHFRLKLWLPISLILESLERVKLPEGALERFLPPEMLEVSGDTQERRSSAQDEKGKWGVEDL